MTDDSNEATDNGHKVGCADCRYHSKSERRKALGVGDAALELVEFDDDAQLVYVCRHENQTGKEMGLPETSPGADCELFEEGGKRKLSPGLERLLKRWEDEEDEEDVSPGLERLLKRWEDEEDEEEEETANQRQQATDR